MATVKNLLPGKLVFLLVAISIRSLSQDNINYYEHVEPIIQDKCINCHHKNGYAPFSLNSYNEVKNKVATVLYVTKKGIMPPWKADTSYSRFENEKFLTENEKQLIEKWIQKGLSEGDKSKRKNKYNENNGKSILGKPDIILKMKYPFPIPGNNLETYAMIKIPFEFDSEKHVEAIEFIPGNKQLVHHLAYEILRIGDEMDYNKGYDYLYNHNQDFYRPQAYKAMGIIDNSDSLPERIFYSGWVPGMTPQIFKGNTGIILPRKGVLLINTIHYSSSSIQQSDNSEFYFYLKENNTLVTRIIKQENIGSGSAISKVIPPLNIPPNEIRTFHTYTSILEDVSVLYVLGHMHLLGKKFQAYCVSPENDTIPILRINNWDFKWQEMYKYNPPLILKKGSHIVVKGTYDNTSDNPSNPFNPPQYIYSDEGMKTTGEMLELIMLYLPYRPGDESMYK